MAQFDQVLLKVAVEKRMLQRAQADKALDLYTSQTVKSHLGEKPRKVEEILLERGFVSQKQLNVLREAVRAFFRNQLMQSGRGIRRCGRCRVRFVGTAEELAQVEVCPACTQPTEPEPEPNSLDGLVRVAFAPALKGLDLQARAALGNNGTVAERFLKVTRTGSNETADVWRCTDLASGSTVAAKIFRRSPPPSVRKDFMHAQQQVSKLQHPHIASILEVGEDAGQLYVVSEYAEGVPLSELTDVEPDRILDAFGLVCEALQHAHDAGILHLNIKPSNIIVDKEGRPKLVDFRSLRTTMLAEADKQLTIYGTLPYLSPEQVTNNRREWDSLTDVYSLGSTLYFVLTGREPFESTEVRDMIRMVASVQPKEAKLVNPEIPEDCARMVKRAMAKLKPFRYPKPITMAKDIRQYLEGKGLRDAYTVMNVKLTDVLEESRRLGPVPKREEPETRIRSGPSPVLEMMTWLLALPGLLVLMAAGMAALAATRMSDVLSVGLTFEETPAMVGGGVAAAAALFAIVLLAMRVKNAEFSNNAIGAFLLAGLGFGMLGALAGFVALVRARTQVLGFVRALVTLALGIVYIVAWVLTFLALAESGAVTIQETGLVAVATLLVLIGGVAMLLFAPRGQAVRPRGLSAAVLAILFGLATSAADLVVLRGLQPKAVDIGQKLDAGGGGPTPGKEKPLRGVRPVTTDLGKVKDLDFVVLPEGGSAEGVRVLRGTAPQRPSEMALRSMQTLFVGVANPKLWWVPWADTVSGPKDTTPVPAAFSFGPVTVDMSGGMARGAVVNVLVVDPRAAQGAYDEGKAYLVWEPLGKAGEFMCRGRGLSLGGTTRVVPDELGVKVPVASTIVLLRDGQAVGHAVGTEAVFKLEAPGEYRVHVYREMGGRLLPWILTGPVTVRPL